MIEDNANNARLARLALEAQSFQVRHAWNGISGLQMALEEHPDLILLDLGLPDVDGQTVATLLRGNPSLQAVPIIAITAWPVETAREMVRAYGCNGYIPKPINFRTFARDVARYLSDSPASD